MTLADNKDIILTKDYPYAVIRIARVGSKFNNFIPDMMDQLDGVLREVEHDTKIRVLIVTGNDRVFSTGVDVNHKTVSEMDAMEARLFSKIGKEMFRRIEDLDIPTVAAVNGTALGGGMELALACDFRVASERAGFGLPETNLGILPGWGGTQRLLKHIGYTKALEMIMMGSLIKASDAYDMGLVQELIPKGEDVVEAAKKWSEKFTTRSRVSIATAKIALRMASELGLKYGSEFESELFAFAWASAHRKLGIEAFANREKPEFPLSFDKETD
ncbi:MAG TPA: enoyl-CoA hydratase/isomerase family protein [bacterium]|jgi:enoyl-CoA hydratase